MTRLRAALRRLPFAALIAIAACSRAPSARPPDIVILLADDLGWADVGYHASDPARAVATPEIDRLASSGLRLEQFRTSPVCTPSRAGLLTGRSPLRLGLLGNLGESDPGGIPLSEELLPAAFARAGYATAMVGKWHVGHQLPEQRPNARGFERFYGFLTGWIDYSTHQHNGTPDWWRDDRPIREEGYSTRLLADEAVRILSEHGRARPLLLYVAFNAPHMPLHVPPGKALVETAPERRMRESHGLIVAELDRAVGDVLRAIDRGEQAGNTIVFFASDNGADARYGGSNDPLRDGKNTVFDGGIRTPAVLAWPRRIGPGSSPVPLSHLDVLPTLAGAAGVALEPARPLDGRDRWPELRSGSTDAPVPVAFAVEQGGQRKYALVAGRWKLVETPGEAGRIDRFLFDLAADPREQRDRTAEEPEKLRELLRLLEPWKAFAASVPRAPR